MHNYLFLFLSVLNILFSIDFRNAQTVEHIDFSTFYCIFFVNFLKSLNVFVYGKIRKRFLINKKNR